MKKTLATLVGAALGLALLLAGNWIVYTWLPSLWSGSASASAAKPVWIVLTFQDQAGRPRQMSFNNPDAGDMTVADCTALLPRIQGDLVKAARAQEPGLLGQASFQRAECIASEKDPIQP